MPPISRFWTPANQQDFPKDPAKQSALNAQWNTNLNGFTQQSIAGNPWNATNSSNYTLYFNPLTTDIPTSAITAPINWNPFPGRIQYYMIPNSGYPSDDQLSLADTGYDTNGFTFPWITTNPCAQISGSNPPTSTEPYGPYGPRGWLDEYCEWAVTRNGAGKITRVDFTCENPEYWNTLWLIDPQRVLELYQETLGEPGTPNTNVKLDDLVLHDPQTGQQVIDPSTGRAAYNPLNKWNSGTVATPTGGGAMHLTSTPNTLQTEMGLGASATGQRIPNSTNQNPNGLLCCGQYGQVARNSDPHIGATVNGTIAAGNTATIANPPGLYIQGPNFQKYTFVAPDKADCSTFWTIVRGVNSLKDQSGNQLPGQFILHGKFEVPASKGYTVADLTIDGKPILWGGQIALTMSMQIVAMAFSATVPAQESCVGSSATNQPQPLQLFYAATFDAYYNTVIAAPSGAQARLASNSTLIAPLANPGKTGLPMVLTADTVTISPLPVVTFFVNGSTTPDSTVTATVTGATTVSYAIPGNSYPAPMTALTLTVNVASNAPLGLRDVLLTNAGAPITGTPMRALFNVVAAGTGGARAAA